MDDNFFNLITKRSFENKINFLGDKITAAAIPHNDVEKIILALTAIANAKGNPLTQDDTYKVNSWRTVQIINRLGLANQYFHTGTLFQCEHTVYGTGEQYLLTWRISGIDNDYPVKPDGTYIMTQDVQGNPIHEHCISLELVDCLPIKYKWHRSGDNTYYQVTDGVIKQADHRAWLNTADVVSTDYTVDKGFLYGLDPEFLEVVGYCAKTTCRGNYAGNATVTTERFFLLSMNETYGGYNNGYAEGAIKPSTDTVADQNKFYCTKDENNIITKVTLASDDSRNPSQEGWYEVRGAYDFYSENSDLLVPGTGADSNRIKRVGSSASSWWLRSPYTVHAYRAFCVSSSGGYGSDYYESVEFTNGLSPACVIV